MPLKPNAPLSPTSILLDANSSREQRVKALAMLKETQMREKEREQEKKEQVIRGHTRSRSATSGLPVPPIVTLSAAPTPSNVSINIPKKTTGPYTFSSAAAGSLAQFYSISPPPPPPSAFMTNKQGVKENKHEEMKVENIIYIDAVKECEVVVTPDPIFPPEVTTLVDTPMTPIITSSTAPPPPPLSSVPFAPLMAPAAPAFVPTTLGSGITPITRRLKKFHWTAVPSHAVDSDSVWAELADGEVEQMPELNESEMEQAFATVAAKKQYTPLVAKDTTAADVVMEPTVVVAKKAVKKVSLLDAKRSYNVDISLARFKMSHQAIM